GCFYFFFQAEDGIRDLTVTGVQTCALPIFETAKGQLLEVVGTYDQEDVAPRSLYAIGVTFEEQGHYDSAVVYYRRILKDYPYSRSEEHTSELQSQSNLVCRLLLEKKKHKEY